MRDLLEMIAAAGFADVEFLGRTGASTSPKTHGAAFRARKPRRRGGR